MNTDVIFDPLKFRNLTVKNRIMRSSVAGRFDNYDGSGNQARINWEEKFARGGVGAIISAHVPVHISGRIMPNFIMIDSDKHIPFWTKLINKVHEYDCKYIIQLSHSGRQREFPGMENAKTPALSSTNKSDPLTGGPCRAMSLAEIQESIQWFVDGARRARSAGADGIELHASHGYLINQFLSSGINDRTDQYGGSLENRARYLLEIIRAIRAEVGRNFHLQVKISAIEYNNYPFFWEKPGNTLEESIQICKWLEAEQVDAIHVSTGSLFPHPNNPKGGWPFDPLAKVYSMMLPNGRHTLRNYLLFRIPLLRPIFTYLWSRIYGQVGSEPKGVSVNAAAEIKKSVDIPVICTGGFQEASYIRDVLSSGKCDAVSMARPLVANNDLPKLMAEGKNMPPKPCTFCNICTVNVIQHPMGCYDVTRYDGDYERMIKEVMTVFEPVMSD